MLNVKQRVSLLAVSTRFPGVAMGCGASTPAPWPHKEIQTCLDRLGVKLFGSRTYILTESFKAFQGGLYVTEIALRTRILSITPSTAMRPGPLEPDATSKLLNQRNSMAPRVSVAMFHVEAFGHLVRRLFWSQRFVNASVFC